MPSFKYTLLSVDQMWVEQGIDSRFANLRRLELPTSRLAGLGRGAPTWTRVRTAAERALTCTILRHRPWIAGGRPWTRRERTLWSEHV